MKTQEQKTKAQAQRKLEKLTRTLMVELFHTDYSADGYDEFEFRVAAKRAKAFLVEAMQKAVAKGYADCLTKPRIK